MTLSFDGTASCERANPAEYLRKREGSRGGLKPQKQADSSSPHMHSEGRLGRFVAGRGSPNGGSPTRIKPQRSAHFWRMYERGDLPVRVVQERHSTVKWTAEPAAIDLHYYLPVFVDGLLETQEPFRMLGRRGVQELIATAGPDSLLPVIPQLIMPLRAALRSASDDIIMAALTVLCQLAQSSEEAGLALVPYYRQLLPPLSRHLNDNLNIGDRMDYGQASHRGSLGDVVLTTLHVLERRGGADAFHHIKYHVPLYESCCRPSRLTRKP